MTDHSSMPHLLRVFIKMMMAFPALHFQILGLGVTAYGWVLVIGGEAIARGVLILVAGFAVSFVMHVVHLLAGHLVGDARYHFVPGKIGARLGWDAGVYALGSVVAGAVWGIGQYMFNDIYGPGFLSLLILAGSGHALAWALAARNARFERWKQERPEAPQFPAAER